MSNPLYARQPQGGDPSNIAGKLNQCACVCVPTAAGGRTRKQGKAWDGEQGTASRAGNIEKSLRVSEPNGQITGIQRQTSNKQRTAVATQHDDVRNIAQRSNLGNKHQQKRNGKLTGKRPTSPNRNIASLQRRQGRTAARAALCFNDTGPHIQPGVALVLV